MTRVRALVLDFDGVLVESNEAKTRAFEDLFALYPEHRQAMMAYHLANYSSPRMAKFRHYVADLMGRPGDEEAVQDMARRFSAFALSRVLACPEVPGARAFLEEFSGRLPTYLASVTPQGELQQIVGARGFAPFFVQVFGDPPTRKADAVREVLARQRVPPSEVVLVGDSLSDYRAAVEVGVEFIGRDSGLAFDRDDVELFCDLYQVAEVVRRRLAGWGACRGL